MLSGGLPAQPGQLDLHLSQPLFSFSAGGCFLFPSLHRRPARRSLLLRSLLGRLARRNFLFQSLLRLLDAPLCCLVGSPRFCIQPSGDGGPQ